MSNWLGYSSGGGGGGGGRWSPWGRAPPPTTPAVRPSDYIYLTPDDIVDPPPEWNEHQRPGYGSSRQQQHDDDDDAPDVLSIKHKGSQYVLEFPAYSISEGWLRVSDVRRQAAAKLGVRESRRVTLLYKSRELRDDAAAAAEEGLKQNSEITCVIRAVDELTDSDDGGSGARLDREPSRTGAADRRAPPPPSSDKQKGKGRKAGNRSPGLANPPDDSGSDYFPSNNKGKAGKKSGHLDPRAAETPAGPSPSPKPSASVFDDSLPSQPLAFKQLADLEKKFRSELMRPCEQLIASPPSDPKKRDAEALRLNELIERDILLKLDAIETEGREDIRQKRRNLTKLVQSQLSQLDDAKKKWAAG